MTIVSMPKMLVSETEGWSELVRIHPTVTRLMWFLVAPMSLIPAVMYAYAELLHPGAVFPRVEPPLTAPEVMLVGLVFVGIEMAMVLMMTTFIQQAGQAVGIRATYADAFALAAIAPTPLWLSSLALFIPSLWVNVLVVAVAWVGSVALIRHGIRPLFGLQDGNSIRRMALAVTAAGVFAWIALMIVLALLVSLILGWR